MDEVCFTIPGDPKPKGRPRFTRGGHSYTPASTLKAEADIRAIVKEFNLTPFTTPVGIEASFFCKTMRRTDGDNMLKLILDSCNELVYTDDYLVEDVHYRVYRKVPGEEPRTEVMFYSLDSEPG